MIIISGKIIEEVGFHARPSTLAVMEAMKFGSKVDVHYGDAQADMKSLISVMKLQIPCGAEMSIAIEGDDEKEAAEAISDLLKRKSIMVFEERG